MYKYFLLIMMILTSNSLLAITSVHHINKHANIPYISISQGIGYNSNVNEVTDNELSISSYYYPKNKSAFRYTTINSYYSINANTFYFDYIDKLLFENSLNTFDERYFSGGYEIQYKQLSLLAYYTYEMGRQSTNTSFSTYGNIYELIPTYSLQINDDWLTFKIPFKHTNYNNYASTYGYGLLVEYSTYKISNLFHPFISIGYSYVPETDLGISNSKEISLSISNYFYPFKKFYGYISADIIKRSNDHADYAYNDYTTTLFLSYQVPFISHLSLNYKISHEYTKYVSDKNGNITENQMELNYIFQ